MNLEEKSIKAKDDFIYRYLEKVDKIVVPRYQRNYAWEKKNIKQLIDDLIHENNYYIGNIIVNDLCKILYLIFDYPYKHYTFKYFEV